MAFTTTDITTLKEALATGALRVRYADGREITYRSVAEVREILRMAEADAGASSGRQHSVAGF